jgi:hypothetical protein
LGISKLDFLNSGADRTSMLHLEKETFNTYLPKLFGKALQILEELWSLLL